MNENQAYSVVLFHTGIWYICGTRLWNEKGELEGKNGAERKVYAFVLWPGFVSVPLFPAAGNRATF